MKKCRQQGDVNHAHKIASPIAYRPLMDVLEGFKHLQNIKLYSALKSGSEVWLRLVDLLRHYR